MQNIFSLLNVKIRKSRFCDAEEIVKINLNCWQKNYHGIVDLSFLKNIKLEDKIKERQKIISDNLGVQLICVHDHKIIGFCEAGKLYFRKNQMLSEDQKIKRNEPGELYALYIAPEYQQKGIGKYLFQEMKKNLYEIGLIPFIVWTFKDNLLSQKFYEKLGGIKVEEAFISRGTSQYLEIAFKFTN